MRMAARIILGLFASFGSCAPAAGQSIVKPGTHIVPQGPLTPKVPQFQPQPTFEVICRGGGLVRERREARLGLFFRHVGYNTYIVEGRVDGLSPATRYYYIATLSNLRGAFHQERGTFTTTPKQD